jgi:tetratricopeptide (TPR) repeat protein
MSSDTRLYAHVIRSLILVSLKENEANIVNCKAVEDDFCRYAAPVLRAGIYANLGISLKNVGQLSEATRYLTLARIFHAKARHKVYLATIYNNLAQLYKEQGRFPEAHDSVDAAIKIYRQIKDRNREGSSLDTKAQIYLVAIDLKNALAAVERSIAILKKSGDSDFLAESLLTKAKVLLFQDRFADAVLSLVDAINILRFRNCEKAGYQAIEEFRRTLEETKTFTPENQSIEQDELELILPAQLGHYREYRGIWINSGHLEKFGLGPGSLAVVVPDELKRGDLAAIRDPSSGNVICGVYDAEFGIVAIQRGDEEPQLFDEKNIDVIGKIVGVCTGDSDGDGKRKVKALNGPPIA